MDKLEDLGVICSVLQILGLALGLIWPWLSVFAWVVIGLAGFAGVVKLFLPASDSWIEDKILRPIAAVGGVGVMLVAWYILTC